MKLIKRIVSTRYTVALPKTIEFYVSIKLAFIYTSFVAKKLKTAHLKTYVLQIILSLQYIYIRDVKKSVK